MFAPDELLLALRDGGVRFIVIGGVAVGVHGFVRATKHLDIVPDPEPGNLTRLAAVLRALGAEHVGVGDFSADEFPYDPSDPAQLAGGANFRLETRLGPLDIMQWVAGINEDPAYPALAREAITVRFRDGEVRVCGLGHLRAMKAAAGREQDLQDLRELEAVERH
jgi:hypothetical protein